MSGPKRNPDSLNTIGVVVVGICGAVMVYVSITALQAFYMNDTSELQTMQDYGGQDTLAKSHKADELRNINEPQMGTPSITIDKAMDLVIRDSVKSPDHLVPAVQPADFKPKGTVEPKPGPPHLIQAPAPAQGSAAPADMGSGAGSGSGTGSAAAGSGAGSANGGDIRMHTTGSPADGRAPAAGAGGAPAGNAGQTGSATKLAPGGHAQ